MPITDAARKAHADLLASFPQEYEGSLMPSEYSKRYKAFTGLLNVLGKGDLAQLDPEGDLLVAAVRDYEALSPNMQKLNENNQTIFRRYKGEQGGYPAGFIDEKLAASMGDISAAKEAAQAEKLAQEVQALKNTDMSGKSSALKTELSRSSVEAKTAFFTDAKVQEDLLANIRSENNPNALKYFDELAAQGMPKTLEVGGQSVDLEKEALVATLKFGENQYVQGGSNKAPVVRQQALERRLDMRIQRKTDPIKDELADIIAANAERAVSNEQGDREFLATLVRKNLNPDQANVLVAAIEKTDGAALEKLTVAAHELKSQEPWKEKIPAIVEAIDKKEEMTPTTQEYQKGMAASYLGPVKEKALQIDAKGDFSKQHPSVMRQDIREQLDAIRKAVEGTKELNKGTEEQRGTDNKMLNTLRAPSKGFER